MTAGLGIAAPVRALTRAVRWTQNNRRANQNVAADVAFNYRPVRLCCGPMTGIAAECHLLPSAMER
jgi:hypothetical protein